MAKYPTLVIISLLVFCTQSILGTPQFPDYLTYNGNTFPIYTNPLEGYFNKNKPRPDHLLPPISTACWRGYIAYWELKNDSLFLKELRGKENNKIDLDLIFTDKNKNSKIFASWYNEHILEASGKILLYTDVSLLIPEYEKFHYFENGIIKNTIIYDNTKTKLSKYSQNTELLLSFIKNEIDYSKLPEITEKVKVLVRIASADDSQKITKVEVLRNTSGNEKFSMEAIRVIKAIPEWDVLYKEGKLYTQYWAISIFFLPKEER